MVFAGRIDADAAARFATRGVTTLPLSDPPLELSESVRRAPELLERAAAMAGERIARGEL